MNPLYKQAAFVTDIDKPNQTMGLTKLEYFVALNMAALNTAGWGIKSNVPEQAIKLAKATLDALAKEQGLMS